MIFEKTSQNIQVFSVSFWHAVLKKELQHSDIVSGMASKAVRVLPKQYILENVYFSSFYTT